MNNVIFTHLQNGPVIGICFVNVRENRPEVEDLPCEEMINQDNLAK